MRSREKRCIFYFNSPSFLDARDGTCGRGQCCVFRSTASNIKSGDRLASQPARRSVGKEGHAEATQLLIYYPHYSTFFFLQSKEVATYKSLQVHCRTRKCWLVQSGVRVRALSVFISALSFLLDLCLSAPSCHISPPPIRSRPVSKGTSTECNSRECACNCKW